LCPAFVSGECENPQGISKEEVLNNHDEDDSREIFSLYDCYNK